MAALATSVTMRPPRCGAKVVGAHARRQSAFMRGTPLTYFHPGFRVAVARGTVTVEAAKKGGKGKKGKKGGKKKGPGSLMDAVKPKEPFQDIQVVMLNLLIIESFKRNVGRPLMEDIEITEAAKTLWDAGFALIATDRGLSEEPTVTYANKAALELLGKTWDELANSPASDVLDMGSSELTDAHERGMMADYSGPLKTASGTLTLTAADVWTIESPAAAGQEGEDNVDATAAGRGKVMGQGVVFSTWKLPDGTAAGIGMEPVIVPTPEEVAAAEKAVAEQGEAIRALKASGLTNQDEEVMEAVGVLLEMKESLAQMQELLG